MHGMVPDPTESFPCHNSFGRGSGVGGCCRLAAPSQTDGLTDDDHVNDDKEAFPEDIPTHIAQKLEQLQYQTNFPSFKLWKSATWHQSIPSSMSKISRTPWKRKNEQCCNKNRRWKNAWNNYCPTWWVDGWVGRKRLEG